MPTSFVVVSLGNLADMDTVEGNQTAENASALEGLTFGGIGGGQSLINNFVTLTPANPTFDSDGNTYYDMNDPTPEAFRIDGGPRQFFDATSVYFSTITYLDGTTANITAVLFQDTNGNTYWAPEFSPNSDQSAIEANKIGSLTLNRLQSNQWSGLRGDRETWDFVPCFTIGARIATARGLRQIETLRVGDLIVTRDNGLEPIRWIGATTRAAEGNLIPIRIRAGALGQGLPERDLLVSPQHRMLVRSRIAERMFGEPEVLVPAKKLLGLPGVALAEDVQEVTYLHLLFDRHELVFADGAPSESLLAGDQALKAMGEEARTEVTHLFPELFHVPAIPARLIPKGSAARSLVRRHLSNAKPALS